MSRGSPQPHSQRRKATTEDPCLKFDNEFTKFTPVFPALSVFYDENNREIIMVSASTSLSSSAPTPGTSFSEQIGTIKMVFQPTHESSNRDILTLYILDEGKITSVKLNLARNILAYKRAHSEVVEFRNVLTTQDICDRSSEVELIEPVEPTHSLDSKVYSQPVRAKNSILIGFVWTTQNEIVFISDNSIEYYHVERSKRHVQCIRSFASATNWFAYHPGLMAVLMISTGSRGNEMQPYKFSATSMTKLQKFQVEGSWARTNSRYSLLERGVTIGVIYGQVRLLVLQNQQASNANEDPHDGTSQSTSRVIIYTVSSVTGITTKTHMLNLNTNHGRFALHIVDDVVVVHDQVSQGSMIFDIMVSASAQNPLSNSNTFSAIDKPRSIDSENVSTDLYSSNWVMFPPNVIVDAKRGILWTLTLDLASIVRVINDSEILLQFLAYRANSAPHIIKKCEVTMSQCFKSCIEESPTRPTSDPLGDISILFEQLARITESSSLLATTQSLVPMSTSSRTVDSTVNQIIKPEIRYKTTVCQSEIYNGVFCHYDKYKSPECLTFISSVVFEYKYSLHRHNIPIEYAVVKMLIDCYVRQGQFYQIQQMINSGLFDDSKQLACLLLSLSDAFPAAIQLALDMLNRLTVPEQANEEIVDVLLSQQHLTRALSFLETTGTVDTASARQFLACALDSQDPSLFFTTFRYFEYRNLRLRGSASFFPGEQCDEFVERFKSLFGATNLLCPAAQQ